MDAHIRRARLRLCATLALLAFTASCKDTSGPGGPPTPSAINATTPTAINASVGDAVPLTVRVLGVRGEPVPDVSVSFAVTGGGGSVAPATASTDASGQASATWTLGTTAGANTLSATVADLPPLTFTATAAPGRPARVTAHSQLAPTATVATAVTPAPAVVVRDGFDNPVPGVAVTFVVTGGDGTLEPATPTTDAAGLAVLTRWTLGTMAGENTVRASVEGAAPVTFSVHARPGPPAAVAAAAVLTQSGIAGSPVSTRPAVRVTDAYGNLIDGVAVQFAVTAGGGTVAGASQTTNAGGLATVGEWTLGPAAGTQTLSATVQGMTPVVFTAEALSAAFNIFVESLHLNQASQTPAGNAPIIHGRPGLLRIVVRASEANDFAPRVRVRLYRFGTLMREQTIEAARVGVPQNPDLADSRQTWNLPLTAAEVGDGLAVEAVVDPDNTIPDSNRADNRFPRAPGTLAPLTAVSLHPLRIVFIPVHASVQNRTGNISSANLDAFLSDTRKWIPGSTILPTIRSTPYTTNVDLSVGGNWSALLAEIQAVRTAEGATDEYYHGIVGTFSGIPWGGFAYIPPSPSSPFRSGITYDNLPHASGTLAHELGHNFGRRHAPCGNPANPDPNYPYANARLGVPGYDIVTGGVIHPNTHADYMSYCNPRWTSDYTYRAILQWRRQDPFGRASVGAAAVRDTEGLLLWGRIRSRGAVLNPAFSLATRPVLPEAGGPNELRGIAADGSVLFRLSFAGVPVADGDDPGEEHFAFFLPLSAGDRARLERIELTTPRGVAVQRASAAVETAGARVSPEVRLESRPGDRARVRWDASRYPMMMVRDPRTGHVLSIGRGGDVELVAGAASADRLEVLLSDGVRSRVGSQR